LGEHVVHSECQTLGAAQSASRVRLQTPTVVQQAPNCGQGFGVQLAAPFQVSGLVQAVCRTSVQAPFDGLQQAPGCGHGLGEQVVQLPFQMLGAAQLA
jgi:hypothetical protein